MEMASTSSDNCYCKSSERCDRWKIRNFMWMHGKARSRRKRGRRCPCEQEGEELYEFLSRLRPKKYRANDGYVVTSVNQVERKTFYESSSTRISLSGRTCRGATRPPRWSGPAPVNAPRIADAEAGDSDVADLDDDDVAATCWIDQLPQEILLLVFGYLPLAMLLLVVPHVCKKWEKLAMDRSLWKAVEHLRIKSMVVTTSEVKTLLRTIPRLKILELVLRSDTEELLGELFRASDHLEMLRLDRCSRSGQRLYIPPSTVRSILESCPRLKSITLTDTYFRSRYFYKCLAEKFPSFERINISCTTKSEMDFFVDNLRKHVPGVEFQSVSMMGKADGKQIYWGPILGLVVRPNPTSPYHRQHTASEFPNYAF